MSHVWTAAIVVYFGMNYESSNTSETGNTDQYWSIVRHVLCVYGEGRGGGKEGGGVVDADIPYSYGAYDWVHNGK